LSGTVETEKQTAWLKQEKERLKKENEQLEKETEQLKKENEQLAVLESKIDGLFSKYGINSKPANPTEEP
jgi:hypothetical protein